MDESKFQYWTIIIKLKKRDYCKKSDNIRTMVKATVKKFLKKIMKFILNSLKSKTENVAPEELIGAPKYMPKKTVCTKNLVPEELSGTTTFVPTLTVSTKDCVPKQIKNICLFSSQ